MTGPEAVAYLRENGYPEHVCRAGASGLIERYRKFVDEVEHGYRFGLEDYRNDLDLRALLTLLELDAEVADADQRLQALLEPAAERLWESGAGSPFWDFGYPRNASGNLRKDLKSEGLL
ncbi:MAG: hypothetical protein NTY38_03590 [Acidobacteria bacterium]|nr:hypothetical protein [Acidobacteriota bacterium]